jgi:hypothetical protein
VGLILQLPLAVEKVKEHRRAGVDFFVSVGVKFGIDFGVGFGFGSDFNFRFNFQLAFLIRFADHALVCHFLAPLARSTWNWFQTAVFKPPP